jgi:xylan 1,4-beta-xylosidase
VNLPKGNSKGKLRHFRIDEFHSNAYDLWRRMGEPVAPDEKIYEQLQVASDLAILETAPQLALINEGEARLDFNLPRQGVSLVQLILD